MTLKEKVTTQILCPQTQAVNLSGKKSSVPGAHKVWGTMKACTTQTVSTSIAQLCPTVAGKLQLRRKFKTNDNGRITRWWFLIQGEEGVLVELQQICMGTCLNPDDTGDAYDHGWRIQSVSSKEWPSVKWPIQAVEIMYLDRWKVRAGKRKSKD